MLNNFEKFSFPSIEKRWTKDKETDGQKEQDQTSNRYDSILQWLRMVYGLRVTYRLSYPISRDAIASKNILQKDSSLSS